MASRRHDWIGAWFDLARTTARASEKVGRAVLRGTPDVGKSARKLLSGVATPAPPPSRQGSGRWEEGRWGLGPLAMRRYRLFLPPGAGLRRPVPLLVLLHGCGQDAASFAAATRAAAVARSGGFAVLLPEQSREANPQRCWNWFRPDPVLATETAILRSLVDHVCNLYPVRRQRLFALGLSAGGAMAMTLALRHPDLFAGVGTHSGAVPHSADNALEAGRAMGGHRGPDLGSLRRRLAGRLLPPLIVIHGEADRSVRPANAEAAAGLWLDLAAGGKLSGGVARAVRRGERHPYTVADWRRDGRPYLRLVRIAHLGHAWSGGAAHQAFADPRGPDALKLAWRFFASCLP